MGKKSDFTLTWYLVFGLAKIMQSLENAVFKQHSRQSASDKKTLPPRCFLFWKGLKINHHLDNKAMPGFASQMPHEIFYLIQ